MQTFIAAPAATANNSWWIYIVLIVLVLVMLILPAITNRKRMKEYTNMIDSVHVGDTIRTVGGLIGRITKINEKDGYKTIIVETGAKGSKTTMEFDIGSIATVLKGSATTAAKTEEQPKEEKIAEEAKPQEKADEQVTSEKPVTKAKKTSTKKSK